MRGGLSRGCCQWQSFNPSRRCPVLKRLLESLTAKNPYRDNTAGLKENKKYFCQMSEVHCPEFNALGYKTKNPLFYSPACRLIGFKKWISPIITKSRCLVPASLNKVIIYAIWRMLPCIKKGVKLALVLLETGRNLLNWFKKDII